MIGNVLDFLMMDGPSFGGVIYGIFSSAPWTGNTWERPRSSWRNELRAAKTQYH